MKNAIFAAVIVGCILAAGYLFWIGNKQVDIDTQRHIDLKRELVRLDSVNRQQQKRFFDSLMFQIDSLHHKVADYEKINARLQQQNAKLDVIYRSIHVADMPDL